MSGEEFLLAVIKYIGEVEVLIEGEWGMGRSLDEIIASDEMPALYAEALRRLASNISN